MRLPQDKSFKLSGKSINEILASQNLLDKLTVLPPLQLTSGPGGKVLSLASTSFMAVLCDSEYASSSSGDSEGSSDPSSSSETLRGYRFKEAEPLPGGGWQVKHGGRQSDGAFEQNGILTELGAIVRLRPGAIANEWFFQWPGPIITPVSCVEESEGSGTGSDGSAGSEGSGDGSFGSGSSEPSEDCSVSDTLEFTATQCVDGCMVETTYRLELGFPVRICVTTQPPVCPEEGSA